MPLEYFCFAANYMGSGMGLIFGIAEGNDVGSCEKDFFGSNRKTRDFFAIFQKSIFFETEISAEKFKNLSEISAEKFKIHVQKIQFFSFFLLQSKV